MQPLYYSTGQVARQLGVTMPMVRALCENRVIAAQTTPGGQWRVPAAEVERLKRDGLPPIPRPLPRERGFEMEDEPFAHSAYSEFVPEQSEEVAAAADQVAIAESTLARRRIERDIEETEDWFLERERQKAAAQAAAWEREQEKQAGQQRAEWIQQWLKYALNSLPYAAREEAEIEVHSAVQAVLSGAPTNQPESITRRLVDAAVRKALTPWNRREETTRALKASVDSLPWMIRNSSEHEELKQRAWDAAAAALSRVRVDASYSEMESAAKQAVQPMIREYEHARACERIVENAYILGAIGTEGDAAKEAVRRAIAALPVGASDKQLELAAAAALAPYKAAVAARSEKARLAEEKESQRRAAEFKVGLRLSHISRYMESEYEFEGGYFERRREADRLEPLIRKVLVEELLEDPDMTDEEIEQSIEDQVDENLE
jgi:excisionase family DNA binding protein